MVHGEKPKDLHIIAGSICDLVEEYRKVCQKAPNVAPATIWLKPPLGMVKINFDGSFKGENVPGRADIIIRDDEGFVLGAKVATVGLVPSSFHVEAIAALYALEFAAACGSKGSFWREMLLPLSRL
ncbi:hypothetical protein PTKIN_Ptkin15bG0049800 [Pterospermum kingtungense]